MREEGEEGKMMLKIDEITHFLRIVKSQHTIRIYVSEAQTSVHGPDLVPFCVFLETLFQR